jgi:hypothetical protein
MAVTDLSQEMPWWARQGAGPTGGPSAAPQGGGASSQDWLQYMMQMAGVGSAQAADNPQIAALKAAAAAQAGGAPPQAGPANIPVGPSTIPPQQPPGPPPGQGASPAPWFNSGNTPMPWNGPTAQPPPRPIDPNVASPAAQPVSAQGPVAGPLSTGGASAMGSSANPRFIGVDAPNASPQNSMRGGPQGTALNLAGLFGGGKPAVSNTRVAGPMANGGAPSGDNWNIDPQTGDVTSNPNIGNPLSAPGRQQMDPTALASAVKKRNWWQNL